MNARVKKAAIVRLRKLRRTHGYRVYVDQGMGDEGGIMIARAQARAERRAQGPEPHLMGYRGDQQLVIRPETVYAPYIPLYMSPPDSQTRADNRDFMRWALALAGRGVQSTERHTPPKFVKVYKGPSYPIDPKLQEERDRADLFSVLPQ